MKLNCKKVGTIALSGAMLMSMAANASAATLQQNTDPTAQAATDVENATIDTSATGSLSIYKYDLSAAEEDGYDVHIDEEGGAATVYTYDENGKKEVKLDENGNVVKTSKGDVYGDDSPIATGLADAAVEEKYADYAVEGVEFSYLKVATVTTYSVTQTNGNKEIVVLYGIDCNQGAGLLTALGLHESDCYRYGESECMNKGTMWYYTSTVLTEALSNALDDSRVNTKNALEEYIEKAKATGTMVTDENGYCNASGLDLGLYLVVETSVPEQVVDTVNPFFVSLPMTTIEGSSWNYDVTVYPKNQTGMPTLEKEVTEVTTDNNDLSMESTATASDGDILNYQIISTLPRITSEATYLTSYTIEDYLSKGLTYYQGKANTTNDDGGVLNALKIEWYDNAACTGTPFATWTQASDPEKFNVKFESVDTGTKMTITPTQAGLNTVYPKINPDYSQYTMKISYSATVNTDATVTYGEDGNPNDVRLTWTRTTDGYYDTLTDECIVYTFGLDMTKEFSGVSTEEAAAQKLFENVQFKVQNTTDGYYLRAIKASDGVYYVNGENCKTANEDEATVFVPNSTDGSLKIYGVEDDQYVITEIATASGYTLLKNAITVNIATEGHEYEWAQNGTKQNLAVSTSYSSNTNDTIQYGVDSDKARVGTEYNNYLMTSTNRVLTASATVDGDAISMTDIASAGRGIESLTDAAGNTISCNNAFAGAIATHVGDVGTGDFVEVTTVDSWNETSLNALVPMTIVNSKGFKLPQTGGNGTMVLTVCGMMAAAGAAFVVFNLSKGKRED